MPKKLSKGLTELLNNIEDATVYAPVKEVEDGERIYEIALTDISANPKQPRKSFNEQSIDELAESIKLHGIIQPLILKKEGDRYVIVAGERRYRAAHRAGFSSVPAIVKVLDDKKAREISLIENLQREDLNAIEEAEAFKELLTRHSLTQESLAARVCKSRPNVANTLRLLNLSEPVKEYVRGDRLSAGHARALLAVTDPKKQKELADAAIDGKLTVRELELKVKVALNPEILPKRVPSDQAQLSMEMRSLLTDMSRIFATKVKAIGNEKKGRIYIDYYTTDDLNRIFDLMERLKKG